MPQNCLKPPFFGKSTSFRGVTHIIITTSCIHNFKKNIYPHFVDRLCITLCKRCVFLFSNFQKIFIFQGFSVWTKFSTLSTLFLCKCVYFYNLCWKLLFLSYIPWIYPQIFYPHNFLFSIWYSPVDSLLYMMI